MPIIYKGRIVQPTMEKPEFNYYFPPEGPSDSMLESAQMDYEDNWGLYNRHLKSIWESSTIHASIELQARFKDGEEIVEGKDYEVKIDNMFHAPDKEWLGNTGTKDYSHGWWPEKLAVPIPTDAVEEGEDEMWKLESVNSLINFYITNGNGFNILSNVGDLIAAFNKHIQSQYKLIKK